MAIEIISRAEAQARGIKRFFTGVPCKRGHIAERICSSKTCLECERLRGNKRYFENPEQGITRSRKWREENREESRLRARRHYAKNIEKRREYARVWRIENPEKRKDGYQRYWAKNPEKRRVYWHKRRARKLKAGGHHTAKQITDLFKKQKGKCAGCFCSIKKGWHNDHIIALSKGGSNDISNIQLLCQPCNNEKYNKDPVTWAQQRGRLL